MFGAALLMACLAAAETQVTIDFNEVLRVSQTTTTLQVVSNPILERFLTAPNGTKFPNPIHDAAFESLANLEADFVRYVPWFPYPHVAVAELVAPVVGQQTSWDFQYTLPMLEDFMAATHLRNHSTVINFSTQPCWLFVNADCSFPANPDESDFGYVRGTQLVDPSAQDLGRYYGRLLSWLMKGSFVDENNVTVTGGPAYSNLTYWEVFNEGEHGYSAQSYTHDYDVVVSAIREMADNEHVLKFVGIGGADPAWIPYFLDRSNHQVPDIPLDFVSVHFYAGCSNRTDPTTFTQFFSGADSFIASMVNTIIPWRDATSASTKFDLDELGIIMPNDNDLNAPALPPLYWNAAGSFFAYLFGNLALAGVDVLGHSQLAGSPEIPSWGIPLPQYPSVSLLSWETGYGNARYWVLKLLLEHFAPGDLIVNTTTMQPNAPSAPVFCAESDGPAYPSVRLQCDSPDATLTVDSADWGTPTGSCPNFSPQASCTAGPAALALAQQLCSGKNSCVITPYPALGDPCYDVVKRFVAVAHCSHGNGGGSVVGSGGPVYALGFQSSDGSRKVLVTNKDYNPQPVALVGVAGLITHYFVDPRSVQASSPNGIGRECVNASSFVLQPFGAGVLDLAPCS